ncbi:MAG TPA: DNA repair protein RecO [Bacteroidales bacterium]|jgi:DNA repair protein RecO (recombination protein O)|nr:DNA repair protein RecO [Bacteroidales bacterium]
MLYKTKAIVLHHVNYGESSMIVTLYSEDHGRISCMVNGVRSKKPKFAATLFQPLTLLEMDIYYKSGREIQRLKDVISPVHYRTIPYNYSKSAITLFLAEVLFLVLREEESNPILFSFLYNSLQWFDTNQTGSSTFHHWFMLHLTRYLGFFPSEDISDGSLLSSEMEAFNGLNSEVTDALKSILDNPQSPPGLSTLSQHNRNQLLERIIRYYNMNMDGFSRLQSFSVLQEVFAQREF